MRTPKNDLENHQEGEIVLEGRVELINPPKVMTSRREDDDTVPVSTSTGTYCTYE